MWRPIEDTVASLVCHGALSRFPELKLAVVENGASWVEPLLKKMAELWKKQPQAFAENPVDLVKRNIHVSPFWEEDLGELAGLLGEDRCCFGSDFPHPEGLDRTPQLRRRARPPPEDAAAQDHGWQPWPPDERPGRGHRLMPGSTGRRGTSARFRPSSSSGTPPRAGGPTRRSGATVAGAVGRLADAELVVHSKVRPWRGTFGEVDRAARAFAASLQAQGVGPGDVVVFQLPNWVEAAITFWGAAQLGAVVVPIVHFYGPKEVGYVLDVVQPDVVVTAARFGQTDYLATYATLLRERTTRRGSSSAPRARPFPVDARHFAELLEAEPIEAPLPTDPDSPAVIGFTSGTTRNPKGVIHSHRTLGFEVRQLGAMAGVDTPANLTGAPVGHFIGMLNAFLLPLLRDQPIHILDVWDPGEVLRIMPRGGHRPRRRGRLLRHQRARPPGLHARSTWPRCRSPAWAAPPSRWPSPSA